MNPTNATLLPPAPDGGEPGVPWDIVIPDAIADGSATLGHDGYDVQKWEEAKRDFPRLRKAVSEAQARIVTAEALMRDLFWSFYKRVVQAAPPVPLTPAHQVNAEIVAQVLSTVEWRDVREAGTVDDILGAALATIGTGGKALAALDQATVERLNRLHELESGAADLWNQAEALDELAAQAQGDRAAALFAQAAQIRAEAQAADAEAATLAEALAEETEAREDAVRRAARSGMTGAGEQIDQMAAMVAAYGSAEMENGRTLSAKDKLHLAAQVGKSRRLQQIAAICGRFVRIALKVQETRVKHPPDEVTTIGIGRDLAHVLPVEIGLLADPDLEDLFLLKFAESRLLQYHLEGREKQGQGPILIALDNSGSMTEQAGGGMSKEVWSKAVTLAMLAIGRKQEREVGVLHFSSPGQLAIHRFPKGRADHAAVIACVEHFFGGGTVFEDWMQAALHMVDESAYDRADVICVSDGLTSISSPMRAEWNRRRQGRGMRAYGVLIGTDEGAGTLASVTDAVLTLNNLAEDNAVLQTIFAV